MQQEKPKEENLKQLMLNELETRKTSDYIFDEVMSRITNKAEHNVNNMILYFGLRYKESGNNKKDAQLQYELYKFRQLYPILIENGFYCYKNWNVAFKDLIYIYDQTNDYLGKVHKKK